MLQDPRRDIQDIIREFGGRKKADRKVLRKASKW